jgi:hypothetical protein
MVLRGFAFEPLAAGEIARRADAVYAAGVEGGNALRYPCGGEFSH